MLFMNKNGEIIIIEDNLEDKLTLLDIFKELNYTNEVLFFETGVLALQYLRNPEVHPFLILSDLNLEILDGMEVRKRIFENEKLSAKCIPYLFFTTHTDKKRVTDAYSMSVQGFFIK